MQLHLDKETPHLLVHGNTNIVPAGCKGHMEIKGKKCTHTVLLDYFDVVFGVYEWILDTMGMWGLGSTGEHYLLLLH